MNTARLIFITGPSGAGKSVTAKEVAARWPTMCALLDFDMIRTFIKSGYAEPAVEWNEETEQQWELAKQIVMAMAKTYVSNGVSVVLEVFATPNDFPKWKDMFGNIPYKAFALLPSLELVLERNSQRQGISKLKERDIKQNYEWSVGWKGMDGILVLDNGTIDVSQVAQRIISQSQQV